MDRPELVGDSEPMRQLLTHVEKIAGAIHKSPERIPTVLIQGETGSGKELIARLIHYRVGWERRFVPQNASMLRGDVAASLLFGNVRGAFTGAVQRDGWAQDAENGTLLLDEIGDLGLDEQPLLLRFLENGQVAPVGGDTRYVRECVIASTNRDLRLAVREGRFRLDLLHRLAGFKVIVPPLRDRRKDIRVLAEHFLKPYARSLDSAALEELMAYSWPGNVRELKNVLAQAVVISEGVIGFRDIQLAFTGCLLSEDEEFQEVARPSDVVENALVVKRGEEWLTLDEVAGGYIRFLRDKNPGITFKKLAKILGVNKATLHRRKQREKRDAVL